MLPTQQMKSGITGHRERGMESSTETRGPGSVYYRKSPRLNEKLTISNLLGDV